MRNFGSETLGWSKGEAAPAVLGFLKMRGPPPHPRSLQVWIPDPFLPRTASSHSSHTLYLSLWIGLISSLIEWLSSHHDGTCFSSKLPFLLSPGGEWRNGPTWGSGRSPARGHLGLFRCCLLLSDSRLLAVSAPLLGAGVEGARVGLPKCVIPGSSWACSGAAGVCYCPRSTFLPTFPLRALARSWAGGGLRRSWSPARV